MQEEGLLGFVFPYVANSLDSLFATLVWNCYLPFTL